MTPERGLSVGLRVDAARHTGGGHLMRCLTLADELRARGARTLFVSRHLSDSFAQLIDGRGHQLIRLNASESANPPPGDDPASWLGAEPLADADETCAAVGTSVDWMVVDHYGIGRPWQARVRAMASRILVIDDLANRDHDCDVLLDQNFYADMHERYARRVAGNCLQLCGPRYALLRPERF
jgi:spore coat polysaccharide biosynthesis predicted glycosyltransferase SpsG